MFCIQTFRAQKYATGFFHSQEKDMDGETRMRLGSYVAGLLFGIGWWFFIDAVAYVKNNSDLTLRIHFVEWLPGIGTTLALFG